jgi:hypothetical protein
MENTYPDGALQVSVDYGHDWPVSASADASDERVGNFVRDANGNVLPTVSKQRQSNIGASRDRRSR